MNYATVDHGVNDLRKCPHCGEVWAKIGKKEIYFDIIYILSFIGFPTIVGCDGDTRCGNSPVNTGEFRNNGVMATFNFQVDGYSIIVSTKYLLYYIIPN